MSGNPREDVAIEATRITMRKQPKRASRLGWATAFFSLLPMIVIMLGALFFSGGGKPWWAEYLMLSWLAAAGTGIAGLMASGASWTNALMSVEGDTLTVTADPAVADTRWNLPIDDIVHGKVIPGFGARLEKKDGGTIDVEVESTRDAERLIAACELPPPERRFTTAFNASWLGPIIAVVGIIGLVAYAINVAPSPMHLTRIDAATWLAMAAALFGGAYFGTRPPKVEVGADGVEIATTLGSRFVRFDQLASVSLDHEGTTLKLDLHDSDPVTVHAAATNKSQQRALRHRIEMGMAAHADAPQAPTRLALLDRKRRSMAEWRDELDQAVNDDTGYRRQPLSRDDLEAILASPTTSTERRIGAALALQALDGGDASPRIRIAAEACAEDRARQALLRIAEQEHEHRAIEQALEQSAQRTTVAG